MKFALSWLKDHLETDASIDEIAARLPMIGLEVEEVIDRGAALKDFVVAEVIEARPHPNADKLHICVVETGSRLQVVCGAPNARAGLKGVFAAVGSFIPGTGTRLKAAAIRGVESAGMLLSEREMQLSRTTPASSSCRRMRRLARRRPRSWALPIRSSTSRSPRTAATASACAASRATSPRPVSAR